MLILIIGCVSIGFAFGFLSGRIDLSLRRLERPMLTACDIEVMLQRRVPA